MKNKFFSFKSRMITVAIVILVCLFFTNSIGHANKKEIGFFILNLHWSDGKISLNSVKEVNGLFKNQKRIIKNKSFFFKVITENNENILSDYFEIPISLKYDSFNPLTKGIEGGVIARSDLDFAIRFPFIDNIREIRFFQCNSMLTSEGYPSTESQLMENMATFLGAVSLKSF